MSADVAVALAALRERVAKAERDAGRAPGSVRLVGAAKGVEPDRVREAIVAGLVDVGHNRAQELAAGRAAVDAGHPGADASLASSVRWHFIGALQRNKIRDVVGSVALIHSVDSLELAEAIGGRAGADKPQDVLIQVNVAAEPTKRGVPASDAAGLAMRAAAVTGLRVRGFMTIPPPGDPAAAGGAFADLRRIRDGVLAQVPEAVELSMGMTGDLEVAIAEGATMVRVGTGLFGPRGRGS